MPPNWDGRSQLPPDLLEEPPAARVPTKRNVPTTSGPGGESTSYGPWNSRVIIGRMGCFPRRWYMRIRSVYSVDGYKGMI